MEEYDLWLSKAKDDLRWTKHNIEAKEFYGACFSAQQAAEKALKGFLLYRGQALRKVHDVVALLEDCLAIDGDFEQLRKNAEILFPYYVETRYPFDEDLVSFDQNKAAAAHLAAEKIVKFVADKLS